jgi:hypothetical protein
VASAKKRPTRKLPEHLWKVPVYLPYLQPALTDAALTKAEARLGVKLPRAYVAALRMQNGGYLRLGAHPSGHAPVDTLAGIGPRFPSLLGRSWDEVKEYMAEEGIEKPARIDDLIPFSGDGHYYYCLDYRKNGRRREPRVTYIDVECFDVDKVVASDFATFLEQLRPDERAPGWGLVTRDSARKVAALLSKATRFRFEDMGDQDHGYPVFRARLPGQGNWAWLSPNRVRRGFVRKTEQEYKKLGKLLPELVDRHPEHADCGYFLTCTEPESKGGKSLARGLAKLPFPTRIVRLDGA